MFVPRASKIALLGGALALLWGLSADAAPGEGSTEVAEQQAKDAMVRARDAAIKQISDSFAKVDPVPYLNSRTAVDFLFEASVLPFDLAQRRLEKIPLALSYTGVDREIPDVPSFLPDSLTSAGTDTRSYWHADTKARFYSELSRLSYAGLTSLRSHFRYAQSNYLMNQYPVYMDATTYTDGETRDLFADWYEPLFVRRELTLPFFPFAHHAHWTDGLSVYDSIPFAKIFAQRLPVRPIPFQATLYSCTWGATTFAHARKLQVQSLDSLFPKSPTAPIARIEDRNGPFQEWYGHFSKEGALRGYDVRLRPRTMILQDSIRYDAQGTAGLAQMPASSYQPKRAIQYPPKESILRVSFKNTIDGRLELSAMSYIADSIPHYETKYLEVAPIEDVAEAAAQHRTTVLARIKDSASRLDLLYSAISEHNATYVPSYYSHDELYTESSLERQQCIKYNAFAALKTGDRARLAESLAAYSDFYIRNEIPQRYYTYSIEGLVQFTYEFISEEMGAIVTTQYLIPAYGQVPDTDIGREVARLVVQDRLGMALVCAQQALTRSNIPVALSRRCTEWRDRLTSFFEKQGDVPHPPEEMPYASQQEKVSLQIYTQLKRQPQETNDEKHQ